MSLRLIVRAGLMASNIHAYTSEDEQAKERFHRDGRTFLRSLAQALDLSKGGYDLRSNRAGIAVSGEVTLHATYLYVQLSESPLRRGVTILYRSCQSQKDFVGGQNHWLQIQHLTDPLVQSKFVDASRRLMVEGYQRAHARRVA